MTSASVSSYNLSSPMLFPPEPAERTLPARGSRSTTSRATTSRRHRGNRSHHGGSSYAPQNEFPYFAQSGDVEIFISADGQEKTYMLHRLILAQNSGFFEASTSEEWSRAQAQAQSQPQSSTQIPELGGGLARVEEDDSLGGVGRPAVTGSQSAPILRWRYELDSGAKDDEVPMLVQKPPVSTLFGGDYTPKPPPPPPSRSKPPASSTGFFRSMANFSAMQSAVHLSNSNSSSNQESEILRDYDNLFRIFYNYPPELDSVNIAEAYVQCKTLLQLADMYDALEVVGGRCDYHLLRFQGRLWKQIAKYPPSYLKLGYLARSKVIFTEALIHVVGQWPTASTQLSHHLPASVLEVIDDKVAELQDLKSQIEGRLFRLTLTTSKGERVTPSNSYLDWTAVSLFRQWLAENTTPPPRRSSSRRRTAPTRDGLRPRRRSCCSRPRLSIRARFIGCWGPGGRLIWRMMS
ncbi:MAG: hypothetical protein FRX48_01263 [Lasallia pustulata]|uniref:BTB domain-containing protein n=1 Tax=Lasallia pustulata TaxID=136370 RepID=A0A5M8Q0L1_9LECA|nr:MAG: hypothetical protein FRX48_01263 [Lasallia pustulata]